MSNITSPLRYPGGKSSLTNFLADVLKANDLQGCTYIEPFCGGAGAALNLLLSGKVSDIVINDADISIHSFWWAILNETDRFLEKVASVPVNIEEWRNQKTLLSATDRFTRGFAIFYLNRCNISGILKANPIGGLHQTGKWLIDARFKRASLIARIEAIAKMRDRITLEGLDVFDFLKKTLPGLKEKSFVYFDPPYCGHGPKLYMNSFNDAQHAKLANFLKNAREFFWLMTYDDVTQIRDAYSYCIVESFHLNHFAHKAKKGIELLIRPAKLRVPTMPVPHYGLPLCQASAPTMPAPHYGLPLCQASGRLENP